MNNNSFEPAYGTLMKFLLIILTVLLVVLLTLPSPTKKDKSEKVPQDTIETQTDVVITDN